MALTKSRVEFLTHSWNWMTGCKHGLDICPRADKCWARSMAHRFGQSFEPTLHPEKLLDPFSLRGPARIGVNFAGDGFGEWVDPDEIVTIPGRPLHPLKHIVKTVMSGCESLPFLCLTKNPSGYLRWGEWPENAWLGFSVCNQKMMDNALASVEIMHHPHNWLSIELMESIQIRDFARFSGISWVVIGGWSGGKGPQPRIEWIKSIVEACDAAGVQLWLKSNLYTLFSPQGLPVWARRMPTGEMPSPAEMLANLYALRQELPAALQLSKVVKP